MPGTALDDHHMAVNKINKIPAHIRFKIVDVIEIIAVMLLPGWSNLGHVGYISKPQ